MSLSNETPDSPGHPRCLTTFDYLRGGEFAIQISPGVGGIFHLSN